MNRLISGPETVGGTGEDGGVVSDDALAPFSSATRAWFACAFAAPTEAQRDAWQAVAAGRHAARRRPPVVWWEAGDIRVPGGDCAHSEDLVVIRASSSTDTR
ncbi:hypothetical protein OOK36_43310 [Streptomyces sp. NBC_00365]|uniref:hypothetical protein n=1 Tax=Streptomyces sp. NBC_00365 TaxID=2975726 RepID=UPI00225846DB|nr:hypothetical protein [Streptomyces sp. NBC_00365]MCX5095557.1 hypothetical protein [Streptomyces sp. NBC_00365]